MEALLSSSATTSSLLDQINLARVSRNISSIYFQHDKNVNLAINTLRSALKPLEETHPETLTSLTTGSLEEREKFGASLDVPTKRLVLDVAMMNADIGWASLHNATEHDLRKDPSISEGLTASLKILESIDSRGAYLSRTLMITARMLHR